MKTALVTACLILSTTAFAGNKDPNWNNPDARYYAGNNNVNQILVTHRVVNNVQEECNKESLKRGKAKFGFAIDACSFWDYAPGKNVCTIVTSPTTSMHEMGHELRHCFQGVFH